MLGLEDGQVSGGLGRGEDAEVKEPLDPLPDHGQQLVGALVVAHSRCTSGALQPGGFHAVGLYPHGHREGPCHQRQVLRALEDLDGLGAVAAGVVVASVGTGDLGCADQRFGGRSGAA